MANIQAGSLEWQFNAKTDNFNAQVKQAKGEVDKVGASIQKTDGKMAGMNKQLLTLAGAYVGFRALTSFVQGSIDKFNEMEAATTKLTVAVLDTAGGTRAQVDALTEQAQALSKVTTFSNDQIMAAQAQLVSFDGLNATIAQKLIPSFLNYVTAERGMNVSNEDMKDSAQGLGKAFVGSMDVLTKQGFVFTDAQKKIFEYGSAAEKADIIIQALSYSQGQAAAAAETFQGRMLILSHQADDMQEAIGGVAQVVRIELLSALTGGSAGMEGFGNNSLVVAKQVGQAFLVMGQAVLNVMNGILTAANTVGAALGAIGGDVRSTNAIIDSTKQRDELREQLKIQEDQVKAMDASADQKDRILERIRKQQQEQDSLLMAKGANPAQTALQAAQDELNAGADRASALNKSLDAGIDKLKGIKNMNDLIAASALGRGAAAQTAGDQTRDNSKKNADELKKEAKQLEDAKNKIIDFRRKEADSAAKVSDAFAQQKEKLKQLADEYKKDIDTITKSLAKLKESFDESNQSADDSLLGRVASAADTAQQTIADRLKDIQTEQNKGAGADQTKISGLQALNQRDQAILDANKELIERAQKAEADAKTALGVQQVIDQAAKEREQRLVQYNEDTQDLKNQLAEKDAEYKKAQLEVRKDTATTIAEIKKNYLEMFDDLRNELIKLGGSFIDLLETVKPGAASQESKDAFNRLIAGKRAMGGPVVPNSAYLVGERGPELFVPDTAGKIVPNGAGGGNYTFNIYNPMDMERAFDIIQDRLGLSGLHAQAGISA